MSEPIPGKVISALVLVGALLVLSVFALLWINSPRVTEMQMMKMTQLQSKRASVELQKKVTELESKLASLESRVNVSEAKQINVSDLLKNVTELQSKLASMSKERKKNNVADVLHKEINWANVLQKVTTLEHRMCTPDYAKKIFRSQAGQDAIMNDVIFRGAPRKTFIEMGMMDGLLDSNSFFFEDSLCWTGLCVEANPLYKKALLKNRPKCRNVIGGICDTNGPRTFVEVGGASTGWSGFEDTLGPGTEDAARANGWSIKKRQVMCHTMPSLLASHHISHVDWWSLDVEGLELGVLKTVDFSNVSIDVISVEINGGGNNKKPSPQRKLIYKLLTSKGYKRIFTIQIALGGCKFDLDDVYAYPHVRYNLKKYPDRFKLKGYPPC